MTSLVIILEKGCL